MDQYSRCYLAVKKFPRNLVRSLTMAFLTCLVLFMLPAQVAAQDECASVKDCAQEMVSLANDLKEENAALLARIQALEAALAKQATDNATALENRVARLKKGSDKNSYPRQRGIWDLPCWYIYGWSPLAGRWGWATWNNVLVRARLPHNAIIALHPKSAGTLHHAHPKAIFVFRKYLILVVCSNR